MSGWVDTVRDQKKVQFVVLRDESGAVQLVHPRLFAEDGTPEPDPLADVISGLAARARSSPRPVSSSTTSA